VSATSKAMAEFSEPAEGSIDSETASARSDTPAF
jgi:hypothetical protein